LNKQLHERLAELNQKTVQLKELQDQATKEGPLKQKVFSLEESKRANEKELQRLNQERRLPDSASKQGS
jgi:hypothetical protein